MMHVYFFRFRFYVWKLPWWQFGIWAYNMKLTTEFFDNCFDDFFWLHNWCYHDNSQIIFMLNYCIFFRFWFYVWKLAWWQFGIWARYEINDRIYRDYGRTLWGTAISHFYETLCASILGGKFLLKFIYSEKATKFATIFHFSLTLISTGSPLLTRFSNNTVF